MLLKYFYNSKIAHASYLVGCQATGEAIVIDPGRDVAQYVEMAEENEMKIVATTETHIHADFISGSRELAAIYGAKFYASDEGDENWKYQFLDGLDHQLLKDGDTFKIGNITFEVMHTPGHTPESISFIVTDNLRDVPMGIFTGDFVFVGDIGRPDLLEEAAGIMGTAEPGAKVMYHSIQRFKQLPDHMQVWPAHGAGSACGKALGAIPSSTVGYEKLFSPLLQYDNEADFVKDLLSGQPEAPYYFAMMKKLNKEGASVLGGLPVPERLLLPKLQQLLDENAIIIDTRPADEYAKGHIPGTINIPQALGFTDAIGWLLDYNQPFYIIASHRDAENAVRDATSIGFDNMAGYFELNVIDQWGEHGDNQLERYIEVTPLEVARMVQNNEVNILDVRGINEFQEGHLPNAQHIMLGYLPKRVQDVRSDKPVVVQCRTGKRSAIGTSLLQANGVTEVMNLVGGYVDWAAAGLPINR